MSRPAPVHVLNGDALAYRFPENLTGQQLIVRECLMEGPVKPEANALFWQKRADYLQTTYPKAPLTYVKVQEAFTTLSQLPVATTVNLWFEHDVFCQTNFWFCCHIIAQKVNQLGAVYFVQPLPQENRWRGFGSHSSSELLEAYRQRIKLSKQELGLLSRLWKAYATKNGRQLRELAYQTVQWLPFLPEVIAALQDATGSLQHAGRPERRLRQLIADYPSADFREIFSRFTATEGIYGYGDLQLQRLYEQLRATS